MGSPKGENPMQNNVAFLGSEPGNLNTKFEDNIDGV